MSRIPAGLIIDDGSPVNSHFFCDFANRHEFAVSTSFTKRFASVCAARGIKGKFSVIPNPQGLGRMDQSVNMLPKKNLRDFLKIVREQIQGPFSITPELITHFRAWDVKRGFCIFRFEDEYINGLSADGITDYISLALEILLNAGLNPTGVTSPWSTGVPNEKNYAEGIGRAFKRIMHRDRCFYFVHFKNGAWPEIICDTEKTGRVVSIPANAGDDPFWDSQRPAAAVPARAVVRRNLDALLSRDGRTGRLRDLFEKGAPMTICTHWQALFSDGRQIGLDGLEELARRMERAFGNAFEWMPFDELALLAKN